MRDRIISAAVIVSIAVMAFLFVDGATTHRAEAATQASGYKWERELGRQKLVNPAASALTIPTGTTHAEFHVEGGSALVRWDGGAPSDALLSNGQWGAFKWPSGLVRKEENDGPKLSLFRVTCTCTLWVDYTADRRVGQ